jgi:bacterioferritin
MLPATSKEPRMPAPRKAAIDDVRVIATLNRIMELELAGVVRYLHYSLMIFGHARIPICNWMREQASEGMAHAATAGEWVTTLGGHPSLGIGPLLETHRHDLDQILTESVEHEKEGLRTYCELLELVRDKSVALEEYARKMIADEEAHVAEVVKMLRRPGSIGRKARAKVARKR